MELFKAASIAQALPTLDELIGALKQGYIDLSEQKYIIPAVGYLPLPDGELHIKYGRSLAGGMTVIKIAAGSYKNHLQGLPASSGCLLLLNSLTGIPIALLQDNGLLTDIRTAVAGALMAKELSPLAQHIGLIGAGGQGYYQALYTCQALGLTKVYAWSRRDDSLYQLASKLAVHGIELNCLPSAQDVCEVADILITTTPATTPYIQAQWLKANVHINAIGADCEGKCELSACVLKQASLLLADSISQCLDHGEYQYLLEAQQNKVAEFGDFLGTSQYDGKGISIADFTGTAVLDIITANMVYHQLQKTNPISTQQK
ncbi:ornithine cyclodeaminase family protein [Shewanella sp. VB17]|uniref:ornithine cyclodeaminase family protein n=1 Tax=Shewanella sp. VB17 TaxID=2739432 RepID=UPI0015643F08|nr:ornithine cyclodeaminase family protein [Shewanella sp. VB17]NRD74930.1 ornithine cyclodeaminase family protein [Shewanella sp. VB17]